MSKTEMEVKAGTKIKVGTMKKAGTKTKTKTTTKTTSKRQHLHLHHHHVLGLLPTWINRWLGYRVHIHGHPTKNKTTPPPPVPSPNKNYTIWLWSFVGAFCGISVIQAVFERASYFVERKVPSIVASYGASAVLIYGAIEAPLAQPRALFGGHFLGALTGIIITKLFGLLPTQERFDDLVWLAGSLSCATSIVVMQITKTVHPPAGATALLAAVSPEIRDIGWYYLPVILLSSSLAFVIALVNNNIQRRYPIFWISPVIPPVLVVDDDDDDDDEEEEEGREEGERREESDDIDVTPRTGSPEKKEVDIEVA